MHTRDMKNAYKQADGRKVDNKRVIVDVERGRTVPNWRPRRLGGGLGSSRICGASADQKPPAREPSSVGRPRSEEPKRGDSRVDRDREKSRDKVRERDRDENPRERSHDRIRERDSREERHHHRDRDRTRDRDRGRDREKDHGRDRDRDRRDRDRDRDRGRDHDREKDRDSEYNGEPKHDRSMADYGKHYGSNQYEQHNSYGSYRYQVQGGHGHETESSKGHEHEYYQAQPNTEPEGPEEGEAYEEGDYQYHQAAEEQKTEA
ncbi:unnamed protein product [Triticum turgidum subsp. durum]|uniref:Uncharacterized protein n=1 Tax=Triticum turgidum subsp. durum TaxID=4567 RepID=A0A9R0Q3Q9_TRITD|nr:unnamed protein product [Triticum turgidum subsp. durum]